MSFELDALRKFQKGQAEHGETFDAEHIDALMEAKNECLDLWNYGSLMPEPLSTLVRETARTLWELMDKAQKETPTEAGV